MAVDNTLHLKQFHDQTKAAGAPAISGDFALEIEGFEAYWLKIKQAPWLVTSIQGEIEVFGPNGSSRAIPQQIKTYHQGPISIYEDSAGSSESLLLNILSTGGIFNAKLYEGNPTRFVRAKRIVDCFFVMDDPDRDWENRAQTLMITGTLHCHYFGEVIPGNSTGL